MSFPNFGFPSLVVLQYVFNGNKIGFTVEGFLVSESKRDLRFIIVLFGSLQSSPWPVSDGCLPKLDICTKSWFCFVSP